MDSSTTPRHKRLAMVDTIGHRASSTPPDNRSRSYLSTLAAPPLSDVSRHSSPGLGSGRHRSEAASSSRITASPAVRPKDRDRTRRRLAQFSSVDDAVTLIKNARNVVVLTGAGISTSLGVPDFRSDRGFYKRLPASMGISEPEEFFSIDYFKHNDKEFWAHVGPLLPRQVRDKDGLYKDVSSAVKANTKVPTSIPKFSKTHAFLALLQSEDKLLTNYTQNIDGLEYAAKVSDAKIVQCHGSWNLATCLTCGKTIAAKKYLPLAHDKISPRCQCGGTGRLAENRKKARPMKKRKRAVYEGDSDHSSDDGVPSTPPGLYKPNITFFGEPIPEYYKLRLREDKTEADLLIVIGTSLKVRPVKTMLVDFPSAVPQIWINKDRFSGITSDMPGVQVDIELLGECDLVVEELCRRAGFDLDGFTWKPDASSNGSKVSNQQEKSKTFIPSRPRGMKVESDANTTLTTTGSPHIVHRPPDSQSSSTTAEPMKSAQRLSDDIKIESEADFGVEWRWRFSKKSVVR